MGPQGSKRILWVHPGGWRLSGEEPGHMHSLRALQLVSRHCCDLCSVLLSNSSMMCSYDVPCTGIKFLLLCSLCIRKGDCFASGICVCVCTHACMYVKVRIPPQVYFIRCHRLLRQNLSHFRLSPGKLAWLASKPRGFMCLPNHRASCPWIPGTEVRSSCLQSRHITNWVIFLNLEFGVGIICLFVFSKRNCSSLKHFTVSSWKSLNDQSNYSHRSSLFNIAHSVKLDFINLNYMCAPPINAHCLCRPTAAVNVYFQVRF